MQLNLHYEPVRKNYEIKMILNRMKLFKEQKFLERFLLTQFNLRFV